MPKTQTKYEQLAAAFADDLDAFNYAIFRDRIIIQDDGDNQGEYIAKWEYEKPLPSGFIVGK